MSDNPQARPTITRVLARPTIAHVALQAELLMHELAVHRLADDLSQDDVDALHRLVSNCLLFLKPDGR